MNPSDYFNPVELDKPEIQNILGEKAFFKNIYTHTANTPVNNFDGIDLVIIGIGEDRNAIVKGSSKAPDLIRNKIYQLTSVPKIKIVDLGNFKVGKEINDTYVGLSHIISQLLKQKINCLIIGGSNDLVIPLIDNEYYEPREIELTTIDARVNHDKSEHINSENYLKRIFANKKKIFYNNIGNQLYLNNPETIIELEKKLYGFYRLGEVKKHLQGFEPVIRNSNIVSLDISSIKQSDAQGQYNPSPNGFLGDEACQLAWYSGLSEKTQIFGIFEVIPTLDINNQTSALAAQIGWHYIHGIANRQNEFPGKSKHFKKFIIGLETNNKNISFYKSELSDRWWLELTNNNPGFEKVYVPCNQQDYDMACKQEIPDIWWKACQRYNIV